MPQSCYTAGRMMQVWPSRFPAMAMAAPYAGNPRALASKVYNGAWAMP
jgi:putative chitinase